MLSIRRAFLALLFLLGSANFLQAQEDRRYVIVGIDERGKLENLDEWAGAKKAIIQRHPDDVFIVAHGWMISKEEAKDIFASFAENLHKLQGKNRSIQVIGIRWPSLLGESESNTDLLFKAGAQFIARQLAKSDSLKERKESLKKALRNPLTRFALARMKIRLPANTDIDRMIDNLDKVENVEEVLSVFSYYQMKHRAEIVGANGLQSCLTELQDALPKSRFHLVGHSFGCKVCLACLESEERGSKQIDSLTLLQGAVSTLCFAGKVDALTDSPAGKYADIPKKVKGCISVTFTKNDDALRLAYVAASQAAGQVAELPLTTYHLAPSLYGALGAKGITGVDGLQPIEMGKTNTVYKLHPGLNVFNADKVILHHNDICKEDVAWLIWSTARGDSHR